jgi:hypothetical protein
VKPTESRDRGGKMMRAFSQNKALNTPFIVFLVYSFLTLKINASWNFSKHSALSGLFFKALQSKECSLAQTFTSLATTLVLNAKNNFA